MASKFMAFEGVASTSTASMENYDNDENERIEMNTNQYPNYQSNQNHGNVESTTYGTVNEEDDDLNDNFEEKTDKDVGYMKFIYNNSEQFKSIVGGLLLLMGSGVHIVWGIFRVFYIYNCDEENSFFLRVVIWSWYVGAILGSTTAGYAVAKFRKGHLYTIGGALLVKSGLLLMFSDNDTNITLLLSRIIGGFTQGLTYVVVVVHASENATKEFRELLMLIVGAVMNYSIFVAVLSFFHTEGLFKTGILNGLGLAAFGVLTIMITTKHATETVPFILQTNGSELDALQTVSKLKKKPVAARSVHHDFLIMKNQVQDEIEHYGSASFLKVLLPENRKSLIFCCYGRLCSVLSFNLPLIVMIMIFLRQWVDHSFVEHGLKPINGGQCEYLKNNSHLVHLYEKDEIDLPNNLKSIHEHNRPKRGADDTKFKVPTPVAHESEGEGHEHNKIKGKEHETGSEDRESEENEKRLETEKKERKERKNKTEREREKNEEKEELKEKNEEGKKEEESKKERDKEKEENKEEDDDDEKEEKERKKEEEERKKEEKHRKKEEKESEKEEEESEEKERQKGEKENGEKERKREEEENHKKKEHEKEKAKEKEEEEEEEKHEQKQKPKEHHPKHPTKNHHEEEESKVKTKAHEKPDTKNKSNKENNGKHSDEQQKSFDAAKVATPTFLAHLIVILHSRELTLVLFAWFIFGTTTAAILYYFNLKRFIYYSSCILSSVLVFTGLLHSLHFLSTIFHICLIVYFNYVTIPIDVFGHCILAEAFPVTLKAFSVASVAIVEHLVHMILIFLYLTDWFHDTIIIFMCVVAFISHEIARNLPQKADLPLGEAREQYQHIDLMLFNEPKSGYNQQQEFI